MAVPATRAAMITGGSGGIGLAVARMLGEEGYALTLVGRRPEPLEAAVSDLVDRGITAHGLAYNLVDEAAVVAAVAAHGDRYGRLDVLVNNAGTGAGQAVEDISSRHLDRQIDLNLRATVLAYREAAPLLRAAGAEHGRALVVNTASLAGVEPQAWLSVYSATKAAVIAFTRAMNRELAGAGVRSCALCPGTVDTAMTEYLTTDRSTMIDPRDLAEVVRMLLRLSASAVVGNVVVEGVAELLAGPPS
ncbi:MAG TPA: SDR family oxidoreductase [Baekduia sp.]|jgi:NAD(P)-dependent dehydrogenase (short-subunit alcohol dehydrogenase family)|nr:SDR family oxidoreductase [Baekduia sp.]